MVSSLNFFWWKLELSFPIELEESLVWKLNDIGIKAYAINCSLDNVENSTLFVWLPSFEWVEKDREEFVRSLMCLGTVFEKKSLSVKWEKIVHEDWSTSWKKFWKPDPVGKNLLILPSWISLPQIYSNRIVLKLDPGSAFGTGSHPTTSLCLEALERNPPKGLMVADVGCGSGILGVASLQLGAQKVNAVDIDSLAVKATAENALLNNFSRDQLTVSQGSIDSLEKQLNGTKTDLLVCNILAPVIRNLAPDFAYVTSNTSHLYLSGLLEHQVDDMTRFLSILDWELIASYTRENWALIHLCRNSL